MATVNFTIPNEQIQRVLNAFADLFPIPDELDEDGNVVGPQFSKAQWARECIRTYIKNTVRRAERKAAHVAVEAAIDVPEDIVADA